MDIIIFMKLDICLIKLKKQKKRIISLKNKVKYRDLKIENLYKEIRDLEFQIKKLKERKDSVFSKEFYHKNKEKYEQDTNLLRRKLFELQENIDGLKRELDMLKFIKNNMKINS